MIHREKYLLIILICLALAISALSCPPRGETRVELRLEKAPRLNEPVKLICICRAIRAIPNEKINVEFEWIEPKRDRVVEVPFEDVLVQGDFNWEAAVTKSVPTEFSAIIKFPHEGKWRIRAVSAGPGWESDVISLYVTEDFGTFDLPKDYRPNTGPVPYVPSEEFPMTVQVDISKAPRLDEAVELTWTINSIRDMAEVNGWVNFRQMEGTEEVDVPAEDILVEGDLNWEGSLKKDIPIQLSAIIRFPEEGDWRIQARARAPEQEGGCADSLFLNVSAEKGRWGWAEPHE
jgi:hypothetical protein